jgi:hypothetical protein
MMMMTFWCGQSVSQRKHFVPYDIMYTLKVDILHNLPTILSVHTSIVNSMHVPVSEKEEMHLPPLQALLSSAIVGA